LVRGDDPLDPRSPLRGFLDLRLIPRH